MAMGGNPDNPNVIEVIDIACDECPVHRISVSESCRGCLAHRCQNACPRGAISFVDRRATIDHTKCVSCGRCAQVCPYGAIQEQVRPCERSCKVGAIAMNQDQTAEINNDKCISCGSCVYQCPFGAIVDKSFILDAIQILKESDQNQKYKVYAVIAPAISSQFSYAKIGQVVTGIKKLGFHGVVEAALGADMTSYAESAELAEKAMGPEHGPLTAFEKACDDTLTAYLDGAKSVPFGVEVVVGYLYAKESELTAVRTVLSGRLAGLDGELIRSRLRSTYL